MLTTSVQIVPETAEWDTAIEDLNALTFGPGRFTRTAYHLRNGSDPIPGLSHIALSGDRLIGSVRFHPITVGGVRVALLGPLCVHPDFAKRGHGLALMEAGIAAGQRQGERLIILVGDRPYYARAGFEPVPKGQITFPGPVDPGRLLALELVPGALDETRGMARKWAASAQT